MECLDHFGLYEADTSPLYTGYFVVQCAIGFWNKPCAIVDNLSLRESIRIRAAITPNTRGRD